MLKKSADRNAQGLAQYLNKSVIIGNIIFFMVTFGSVICYRHIRLSMAAILGSSNYVFIPVLSRMFLKERITKRQIMGTSLILSGIIVYALFGR
jgi:drug/metabolite transporter (DMT)-like permease